MTFVAVPGHSRLSFSPLLLIFLLLPALTIMLDQVFVGFEGGVAQYSEFAIPVNIFVSIKINIE